MNFGIFTGIFTGSHKSDPKLTNTEPKTATKTGP